MHTPTRAQFLQLSKVLFLGLLAYAPLHIFISTLIGANLGGLALLKVLKDIVALFGFCLILGLSIGQPWFKAWIRSKLVLVIMAYGLLTVLLAAWRPTDLDAEVLGVTYNLRFLIFFLYGWLLAKHLPVRPLLQAATKVVLASGLVVVSFGLIQYWFLPNNALTHLGFTKENGVFPAFFIDDKPNLERVMSTVRDPNSLGSYLIITASLLGALLVRAKRDKRMFWGGLLLATVLCLFLSFSRSALLGLALALVVGVGLLGKDKVRLSSRHMRLGLVAVTALLVLLVGGLYAARNTYAVQNVIFHADQSTTQEDPNQLRVRFLKESVQGVVDNPLGRGPGTAGLASIRNNVQGTQLNENYYLQIATEVGILGLLLFVTILGFVAWSLYRAPISWATTALLASFAGLAFTNLLVHIWSNEAVAYTWWGLAGLVIALPARSKKRLTKV